MSAARAAFKHDGLTAVTPVRGRDVSSTFEKTADAIARILGISQ